jgi:hypothetical protein
MAETESTTNTESADRTAAIGTALALVNESPSTPTNAAPHYALYRVLVEHLSGEAVDGIYHPSFEQWEQLKQVSCEIALAIHSSTQGTDAQDLMTVDFHDIVRTIRRLKKSYGLSELGVAILLDNIIDKELYKDLYGCSSPTDFFRRCDELIGYSSSRARDFQARGGNFKRHWKDIRQGYGAVPGISIEDLCLRHLTKLGLYDDAVALFEREEALRLFTQCSYRDFAKRIKDEQHKSQKVLQESPPKTKKARAKAASRLEGLELSSVQLKALHIMATEGTVHLLSSERQDQIDRAIVRLSMYRSTRNAEARAKIGHKPYDPQKPLVVNKELMDLNNAPEIVDRIRAGVAQAMPCRRTIAILIYRLASEPYFRLYWHRPGNRTHYTSFGDFAKGWLDMGDEFRDYIRVGKNLAQHYYMLDSLEGIDTDIMFYKLRFLDDAVLTHHGDTSLIRARLVSLSCREFAKFARDPNYEQNLVQSLSRKKEEAFLRLVAKINTDRENGLAVGVVELFTPDEAAKVQGFLYEIIEEDAHPQNAVEGHDEIDRDDVGMMEGGQGVA